MRTVKQKMICCACGSNKKVRAKTMHVAVYQINKWAREFGRGVDSLSGVKTG